MSPISAPIRMIGAVVAVLSALAHPGCGASAGAVYQPPVLDGTPMRVGAELGYHAYLLESQGLLVGATGAYLPPRSDACCSEWRLRLDSGYGVLPLPHEGRFGFESTLGPTVGVAEVAGDSHFALGGHGDIAVPFRFTRTKALWNESRLETIGLLIPKVRMEFLSPLGDVSHRPLSAIEFSLNVRLMTWHLALP